MAYTSPSDVRAIERKLPTSITDQNIQVFITKAEAYVNGLLGEVYVTPFSTTPELIKVVTTDLSVYFLIEALYTTNSPNLVDASKEKFYDRSIEMLNKIAEGELSLGADFPRSSEAGFASTNNDEPVFTLDDPFW